MAALPNQSSGSETPISIDERRRAPWLQSAYSDPIWIVADTRNSAKTEKIDFRYMLADGRLLVANDRLYATVKEYAFWVRDPRYSRIDDAQTHLTLVRSLMHIAHALTLRKINSFAHLQPYDVEQLIEECRYGLDAVLKASKRVSAYLDNLTSRKEDRPNLTSTRIMIDCRLPHAACYIPSVVARIEVARKKFRKYGSIDQTNANVAGPSNLTAQSIQRWLDPLEQLYAMRRRLEADSISFKPFPLGASRVAAVKGVGTQRTPTPPPKLALHLLEYSARWIFNERVSLVNRQDVIRMATACWIVIAAFTARRDEEIDDLEIDCIRGDPVAGLWIHIYVAKTLQRKEWFPVPVLVARAVEVLTDISKQARESTGSAKLFRWRDPDGNVVVLNQARYLDKFAELVGVPLHTPRGGPAIAWHWHPHQFRRFFAVLYFYRFEGATLEALSYHLRHFSLEMTKRYLTQDPEVAALWTDVEWGYEGDVARAIVAGERSVSGALGERLKKAARKLVDVFRRKLQVVTPERIGAAVTMMMQRQGLVLTPQPWGTCTCPQTADAAAKASCRRLEGAGVGAVGPNFAYAGPTVCPECPHAMVEGNRKGVVGNEIEHLKAVDQCKPRSGTMFGALEEAQLVKLSQIDGSRFDAAKPLEEITFDAEDCR